MTIYAFKSRFQGWLRPLVQSLSRAGVTANQVTVAACVGSVLIGLWLYFGRPPDAAFLCLSAWMLVRMALNAVDGMLAREHGQQTRLGGFLNELTDVISDAALYLPFARIQPFDGFGIGCVIVLAGLSEFSGVLGTVVGASRRYDGPMGKSDRAFVFGVLAFYVGLGGRFPTAAAALVPLIAVLVGLTVINRVRKALQEAEGRST